MRPLFLQDQRSVQRETKSAPAMQPVNIFSWAQTCCGSLPVCLGMCREALQCCTVRERQREEFWQVPSSFLATVLLCEEKHLEEIKDCILCVYVCVWVRVCVRVCCSSALWSMKRLMSMSAAYWITFHGTHTQLASVVEPIFFFRLPFESSQLSLHLFLPILLDLISRSVCSVAGVNSVLCWGLNRKRHC